jgi:aminopeptidase N
MLRSSVSVPGAVATGAVGVNKKAPVTTVPGTDKTDSIPLKTKDRFDIATRLAILGDPDAPKLLADLEKTESSDDAKRYAYAAHSAFATRENREKFWTDFTTNKDISESWIEAAMGPFNSPRHAELSRPYLQQALAELPNLKRNRKIFFVNGWLGAFIGGQRSQEALDIVNKFLADNPNLDRDLRLKILENVDTIERAVNIRKRYGN